MKKVLFSVFLFSFMSNKLKAQQQQYCFTDEFLTKLQDDHQKSKRPGISLVQDSKTLNAEPTDDLNNKSASTTYTIPVVFHILHQGGTENITDAQINSAMIILNRDYRKKNPDTTAIITPFIGLATDANFEFRLATKDTNGNCTTGITRHFDPDANWPFTSQTRYRYTWNSRKYLNIYVVKTIVGFGTSGAYTPYPGITPDSTQIVVIYHNSVGDIGTSNISRSRTLTHEIGHWFNLKHPWGDFNNPGTVCGDDGVSDTPITKGFVSCPTGSPAICNPNTIENYQNYMDYSGCANMFTAGQVSRMTAAINSSVAGRNNLWTNSNLLATGVINPVTQCSLIATAFAVGNGYTVCVGQNIAFSESSYNGTVNTISWSATGGGLLSSSNTQNTFITFPSAGTQTVTLQVSNVQGSSVASNTVLVLPAAANVNGNYSESFETQGLPANFSIFNDDSLTWTQTILAAASGSESYYINGLFDPPNKTDILQTPSYDFLNNPAAAYTFKWAYAKLNSSNNDVFKVQASRDCGATWTDIYKPSNSQGSGGTSSIPFVPNPWQFVTYTLTDSPYFASFLGEANVKFRFSFQEDPINGHGNNIFLDDLNFTTSNTGMNELSKSIEFKMYPNPASEVINLEFTLSDNSAIRYDIINALGRSVEEGSNYALNPGNHKLLMNENKLLKPGIYFVAFTINGQKICRKLVIY